MQELQEAISAGDAAQQGFNPSACAERDAGGYLPGGVSVPVSIHALVQSAT